jgi:hypothetical protein
MALNSYRDHSPPKKIDSFPVADIKQRITDSSALCRLISDADLMRKSSLAYAPFIFTHKTTTFFSPLFYQSFQPSTQHWLRLLTIVYKEPSPQKSYDPAQGLS